MPILGFRHIQDPGITVSNNVKQHLLFKSGSLFKSLFRSIFSLFQKSKHSTFLSSGWYFNDSNNNNNNMPSKLARHPHHPHKHAIHATHASTPPTLPTLACHPRHHASTNSTSFLKLTRFRLTYTFLFVSK